MEVLLLREGHQGCDIWGAEGRIASCYDILEVIGRYLLG